MGEKPKDFALYKGDELLCIGTVKEISKEMNLRISTLRYYATTAHKKKCDEKGKVLVCLDYE